MAIALAIHEVEFTSIGGLTVILDGIVADTPDLVCGRIQHADGTWHRGSWDSAGKARDQSELANIDPHDEDYQELSDLAQRVQKSLLSRKG